MKNRIAELDYVRAVSMLAIIALHVTSAFIFVPSAFAPAGMNLAFLINQLMRFAVPAFILLSGVSLAYGKADEPPLKFYKSRLTKAVLPYILWYGVYFAYNYYYAKGPGSALAFLKGLLRGNAAPHLYFMVIIIQLYILFPLLVRLLKKYRLPTLILSFLLSLYFQTGIYLTYFGLHILPKPIALDAWLLFPTWIFYFTAGLLFTRESLLVIPGKLRKYLYALFAASLLLGLLVTLEGKIFKTFDLSIKPELFIYTAAVFAFLLGFGSLFSRSAILNEAVSFLSKRSMTVYFSHILVLSVFRLHNVFQKGMSGMLLLLISVTVISVALASLIDWTLQLIKNSLKFGRAAVNSERN